MIKKILIDARQMKKLELPQLITRSLKILNMKLMRKQLKGNIYLARITRVEPSLQAAFSRIWW